MKIIMRNIGRGGKVNKSVFDITIDQTTPDIFAEWLAIPVKSKIGKYI